MISGCTYSPLMRTDFLDQIFPFSQDSWLCSFRVGNSTDTCPQTHYLPPRQALTHQTTVTIHFRGLPLQKERAQGRGHQARSATPSTLLNAKGLIGVLVHPQKQYNFPETSGVNIKEVTTVPLIPPLYVQS